MIANLEDNVLIGYALRCPVRGLLEQARYTLELAWREGAELADALPNGFLDELAAQARIVSTAAQDRALVLRDAVDSTRELNIVMRQSKIWRRRVANIADMADLMGFQVPEDLLSFQPTWSRDEWIAQMELFVKLVGICSEIPPHYHLGRFLDEGEKLLAFVKAYDPAKELEQIKRFSAPMRNFYRDKGLLYIGIKMVNDIGRSLYDEEADAEAWGAYNLTILYRSLRCPTAWASSSPVPAAV
jgi:hypothetical protein